VLSENGVKLKRLTQFQNTAANIKSNAGNVVATIGVKL
jgi:hypothetical protein